MLPLDALPMSKEPICNLCGLTCLLKEGELAGAHGHLDRTVRGGYASTPGNGVGALDDMTSYTFNLCEFCCDALFTRCAVPVTVEWHGAFEPEPWRPALQRVVEDDWRAQKGAFFKEAARRALARRDAPERPNDPAFVHAYVLMVLHHCELSLPELHVLLEEHSRLSREDIRTVISQLLDEGLIERTPNGHVRAFRAAAP